MRDYDHYFRIVMIIVAILAFVKIICIIMGSS
jgi:hypothetical protein